jgi:glycosyltransferase involved in cell wall biosynthesis
MYILFLTPQVPYPPRQGTSIRNYHLIARLAQHHKVDLLTFLAPGDNLSPDNPLFQHCRRIEAVPQPTRTIATRLRSLLTSPLPDMALRLESPAMHDLVQRWLRDTHYDIVQIEGIELAQYARHIPPSKTAFLFDDHNCEYLLQQRNALTDLRNPRRWHAAAYSLVQWAKLRRYEAQVCNAAQAVLAVSKPDQAALQRIAPQAAIHVAPNGIDLTAYAIPQGTDKAAQTIPGTENSDLNRFTLLFTGKMDYRPNIDAVLWFAHEVLPNLITAAPQIHLQIVGMNPHPRLDSLRRNPHIEITGTVPDPIPYLHAANLYIIPMRVGGGTRFKALEAMAAQKAIVSTTLGVEGIGVESEREMLIADSPDEFAVAILRFLVDQQTGAHLTHRLGQNAHRFVTTNYTWDHIIPTIEHLYHQLYEQLQPSRISTNPRPLAVDASGAHQNPTGTIREQNHE